MNTFILLSLLASMVLGENSISVRFEMKGCTSNCATIKNAYGKVQIRGFLVDPEYEAFDTEIIEQEFNSLEIPFTLNIVYPDNPSSVLANNQELPPEEVAYFVKLIWDINSDDLYENCGDEIVTDGDYPKKVLRSSNRVNISKVDLYNQETQTVYVKEEHDDCKGRVNLRLECSPNSKCEVPDNGGGGFSMQSTWIIYGFDESKGSTESFKIEENWSNWKSELPHDDNMYFDSNPSSKIKNLENQQDARYYFMLEGAPFGSEQGCDLVVDTQYEFPLIELEEGDYAALHSERQTIYVKKRVEDANCDAACDRKVFVKLLLCLSFVIYILV
eukprot:191776_1